MDSNTESGTEQGTRLNKYLASCGMGARRTCDELIHSGQVIVNGKVCQTPATRVTEEDHVKIDGRRVLPRDIAAIVLNKPRGYVCSKEDEHQRETIYNLLPPKLRHLNHVGRLDRESEGIIILTNDGDFSQELSHPKKKTEKEYLVTVNQSFDNEVLDRFLKGIYTPEGKAVAKATQRLSARRFTITLETGLKRQIRMMCRACHLQVTKLVRIRIGTFTARGLEQGRYRHLDEEDILALKTNPTKTQGRTLPSTRRKPAARKGTKKRAQTQRTSSKHSSSSRCPQGLRSTKRSAKSYKKRR